CRTNSCTDPLRPNRRDTPVPALHECENRAWLRSGCLGGNGDNTQRGIYRGLLPDSHIPLSADVSAVQAGASPVKIEHGDFHEAAGSEHVAVEMGWAVQALRSRDLVSGALMRRHC